MDAIPAGVRHFSPIVNDLLGTIQSPNEWVPGVGTSPGGLKAYKVRTTQLPPSGTGVKSPWIYTHTLIRLHGEQLCSYSNYASHNAAAKDLSVINETDTNMLPIQYYSEGGN